MRRRGQRWLYAFDVLWLDGHDLRDQPLIERKAQLRAIVPPQASPLLYVKHLEEGGTEVYRAVCEHDLEGIVAKFARVPYRLPDAWVKIKNPHYQAVGRREWFEQARAKRPGGAGAPVGRPAETLGIGRNTRQSAYVNPP